MDKITHPEMVKGLAKDGQVIVDELTPELAHLLHMAVGVAGEAGELCQAIYGSTIFAQIDIENVVEELGDIEFYMEGLRQGLKIERSLTVIEDSFPDTLIADTTVACMAAISINIEASVLLDSIKKSAFYIKPVKLQAVIDSLTIINTQMFGLRSCCGITYEDTIDHNIEKLGERYKGHSYSNEQAITRADKG